MNEPTLTDLLEHTADRTTVGPAPVAEIARGARRRQRRLAMTLAVTTLACLAVATALVGVTRLHRDGAAPAHQVVNHPNHRALGPDAVHIDGTWVVQALVGPNGHSVLPKKDRGRMRLTFHHGRMIGSTTCNTIAGRYVQSGPQGQNLRLRSLTTTLVGCTDEPPLMSTLREVRHITVADHQHYLHAGNWMILVALTQASSN